MELHKKGSVALQNENENEIPFENELPEDFVKKFKFKMEYEKLCEWEIDKQEFKKYVLICEKLREFVKTYSGEVIVDYKTMITGKDPIMNTQKIARCEIKFLTLGIVKNEIKDLITILKYTENLEIDMSNDNQICISFYFPNVYINKGITLKFNDDSQS